MYDMSKYKSIRFMALPILALMLQACTNMLFQPSRQHMLAPDKINLSYSDVNISAGDGVGLHGWYLPASVPVRGTILFLHGNGQNISNHLATVYWLPAEGYNVYLFDYRGYGKSQGEVGLAGSMLDIEAMMAYVAANKAGSQKMIVLGHSLGASMGVYAVSQSAFKTDIAALVSISGFSDYGAVTRDFLARSWITWPLQWPLSLTMNNRFSPKKFISQIAPVPVLIMHSDADEMIETYHADVLFKAALEPKYFQLLHSDHNHVFNDGENRRLLLHWLARF
jgi:uncharacterized protein